MRWIGGQWLDSGERRESINPATGEVIVPYAKGGRKEAELAVNAALRAFRETDWKDNRSLRARALNAMAARFEARAEHLAQLLATEVGKILPDARFETATVPFNLRFNAALALTEYGRAAGAARLKRFGLELGGKTPVVIFDDADLDAAVAKVTAGLTVFAGQFCITGSRAIVQRGIANRFRTALAERLKKVRVGPAMTFLNANTSPSSRGRSSVEGAPPAHQ